MKPFIWLSFLLFFNLNLFAQELLPNAEFKQVNRCCEYHVSCAPMGWWTAHGGTLNFKKNTFSKDGKLNYKPAYFRHKSDLPNHRSYIQAPILCPLEAGERYKLSVVIRAETYLPDQIGILFSDSFINEKPTIITVVDSTTGLFRTERIDSLLPIPATHKLKVPRPTLNRSKKIKLSFTYTAHGHEKFVLLGNFLSDENNQLWPRLFPLKKPEDVLIEVYEISLKPMEVDKQCDTKAQLELLETYNRRHTFYGACRDSIPPDFNLLFSKTPGWQSFYHSPKNDSSSNQATDTFFNRRYILNKIFFEFDSARLLPESYPSLDSLIRVLDQFQVRHLQVSGHTDSLGTDTYNDSLSLNRAEAVKSYLLGKRANLKIQCKGEGSSKPIRSNASPEGRALNRRVEIIFLKD